MTGLLLLGIVWLAASIISAAGLSVAAAFTRKARRAKAVDDAVEDERAHSGNDLTALADAVREQCPEQWRDEVGCDEPGAHVCTVQGDHTVHRCPCGALVIEDQPTYGQGRQRHRPPGVLGGAAGRAAGVCILHAAAGQGDDVMTRQILPPAANPAVAGHWQEITKDEHNALPRHRVGAHFTDPYGDHGDPHMLTEWIDEHDQPVSRHQCWPNRGIGWARPCLWERWVPAVPAPSACRTCGGSGMEWRENTSYADVVYGGGDGWTPTGRPCPDCRCTTCGQPTDTPPECRGCDDAAEHAVREWPRCDNCGGYSGDPPEPCTHPPRAQGGILPEPVRIAPERDEPETVIVGPVPMYAVPDRANMLGGWEVVGNAKVHRGCAAFHHRACAYCAPLLAASSTEVTGG